MHPWDLDQVVRDWDEVVGDPGLNNNNNNNARVVRDWGGLWEIQVQIIITLHALNNWCGTEKLSRPDSEGAATWESHKVQVSQKIKSSNVRLQHSIWLHNHFILPFSYFFLFYFMSMKGYAQKADSRTSISNLKCLSTNYKKVLLILKCLWMS